MTKIDKLWFCECGNEEYHAPYDFRKIPIEVFVRKSRGKVKGAVHWSEFKRHSLTAERLSNAVKEDLAFCALFGKSRKHVDFIGAWHMCLDFDDNHDFTLETICENSFVMLNASFVHTTTSHTDAKPRLRVVFLFAKMITTIKDYQNIAAGMAELFPTCETASIGQASKPWSGARDCKVVPIWKYVDVLTMERLRKRGVELRKKPEPVKSGFFRIGGSGNYEAYVKACFDRAEGEISQCVPTATNDKFNVIAFGLFKLAKAGWNDETPESVMAWLSSKTGDFWGGRHRATAESARDGDLGQGTPEPKGKKLHRVGIGEMI